MNDCDVCGRGGGDSRCVVQNTRWKTWEIIRDIAADEKIILKYILKKRDWICVVENRACSRQLQKLQVDLRVPYTAGNFMWYCIVLFFFGTLPACVLLSFHIRFIYFPSRSFWRSLRVAFPANFTLRNSKPIYRDIILS